MSSGEKGRVGSLISRLVDDGESKAGWWFAIGVQILIVLSLLSFSVSTLPGLDSETNDALRYSERAIVFLFTLEYLFRVYAAERKFAFVVSFYGLIDLAAIIPFYLSFGVDLRAISP